MEKEKEKELPELWLLWAKPPDKPGFYLGLGGLALMATNEKDANCLVEAEAKMFKPGWTVTPTKVK